MLRSSLLVIAVGILASPAVAAGPEEALRSRWERTWVVVQAELLSNCDEFATPTRLTDGEINRERRGIMGRLTRLAENLKPDEVTDPYQDARLFERGEIAWVEKLSIKKSAIALTLDLAGPVLLPVEQGPFTLFREARCRVALSVDVPREAVQRRDGEALAGSLAAVLEAYASEEEARASPSWNGRARDVLPEDYEATVREARLWWNATLEDRAASGLARLREMAEAVPADADYLLGFSWGVQDERVALEEASNRCKSLIDAERLGTALTAFDPEVSRDAEALYALGSEQGELFALALAAVTELPKCRTDVAEGEEGSHDAPR